MLGMEIAGLYVVMAAAIIGGLVLLWLMLRELIHFDASRHRVRSARIPEAVRPPTGPSGALVEFRAASSTHTAGVLPRTRVVRGAVH